MDRQTEEMTNNEILALIHSLIKQWIGRLEDEITERLKEIEVLQIAQPVEEIFRKNSQKYVDAIAKAEEHKFRLMALQLNVPEPEPNAVESWSLLVDKLAEEPAFLQFNEQLAELLKASMLKGKEKLQELHQYIDGEWDCPVLNSESYEKHHE